MCGIIGIFSQTSVSNELYNGLVQLQHRGQDAAGILTFNGNFHIHKRQGLVRDVFNQEIIASLAGNMGLGHTRYPTNGSAYDIGNAQPFMSRWPFGVGMVHNGNLTNYQELKEELLTRQNYHCNSGSDLEVILGIFSLKLASTDQSKPIFDRVCAAVDEVYARVRGGYSVLAVIAGCGMLAFRDPNGIRPLVWGSRISENGQRDFVFASENGSFYSLGFEYISNVGPGEVMFIDLNGQIHQRKLRHKQFAPCAFEYIYFARPDAYINNVSVYRARSRMGQNLGLKWKQIYPDLMPDVVIPVPFSANTAALALAQELGVRYSEGLYKNPFVGRTFIMPNQQKRQRSINQKLTPQPLEIKDKVVMLVDDSIVRGTTSREVVRMARETGAKEIYFVSCSPAIKYPDFYGIDIATSGELIAATKTEEEIRQFIGADKLMYQDLEGLVEAITRKGDHQIDQLSMPWFDGWYVTGDVDTQTIQQAEKIRQVEREAAS
jgi:amidophosphoribosyltransferase